MEFFDILVPLVNVGELAATVRTPTAGLQPLDRFPVAAADIASRVRRDDPAAFSHLQASSVTCDDGTEQSVGVRKRPV